MESSRGVKVNVREWLLDLAEHYYWDIIDGEVCILPIKDDEYE